MNPQPPGCTRRNQLGPWHVCQHIPLLGAQKEPAERQSTRGSKAPRLHRAQRSSPTPPRLAQSPPKPRPRPLTPQKLFPSDSVVFEKVNEGAIRVHVFRWAAGLRRKGPRSHWRIPAEARALGSRAGAARNGSPAQRAAPVESLKPRLERRQRRVPTLTGTSPHQPQPATPPANLAPPPSTPTPGPPGALTMRLTRPSAAASLRALSRCAAS
jgi:hypothetical protein